jgi:hypothetical protein
MISKKDNNVADTNSENPTETLFERVLSESYVVPPVSSAHRNRLAQLATEADFRSSHPQAKPQASITSRRNPLTNWLTASVLVATAFVGVGIYVIFAPRKASASDALILRVTSAAAKVKTAHILEWRPFNGTQEVYREAWYSAEVGKTGAWCKKGYAPYKGPYTVSYTNLWKNGIAYYYSATAKTVQIDNTQYFPSLLSASDRLQRLYEADLSGRVRILPEAMVEGKRAKRLLIELPNSRPDTEPAFYHESVPLRAIVAVDPKTDLPFRTETEAYHNGQWKLVWVEEAQYNLPIPTEHFDHRFPGSQKVYSVDAQKRFSQQMRATMAKSYRVAKAGRFHATLRYLIGTELGDVYVLYSLPKGSPLPKVLLRDQTTRTWHYMGGGRVGRIVPELEQRWIQPDGERLYTAWFRNNEPMTDREGGGWKIHFHFGEVGGGMSDKVSPVWETSVSGAVPPDDFSREIVWESAEEIASACRNRAEAFRDGRWKADIGLLRIALTGELPVKQRAIFWDSEATRIERTAAELRKSLPSNRAQ